MSATAPAPPAVERALSLLDAAARPDTPDLARGYLNLLADDDTPVTGTAQRLMLTSAVPAIYEHWWRPALGRVAKGAFGPGMRGELRIALDLLGLRPGDGVLDIACGPGNFTRALARVAGPDGLAVGIDASRTMLARAVRDTPRGEAAYVRGDAVQLPFRDASFDAVCCFAALHLFADPFLALDHMARVLTPGGRVAIFTSARLSSIPGRALNDLVGRGSGMRIFERDEIAAALRQRGFEDVRVRLAGLTQFTGARKGS